MTSTETQNQVAGTPADIQKLMQIGSGLMYAAALHPVAKLKIADLLAGGPLTVDQLAQRTGSNADALYRVLRFLSGVGLFAESPQRTFALTPISHFLRADVPGSARDMLLWMGNEFHFQVWSQLAYSIQTGQPAVEKIFGKPAFETVFGDPEVAYDFNMAMTCFSRQIAPALLDAYDFSGIGTLMDVAGGHGAILCEVLTRYPSMKGILFDLPNVIQEANCHICDRKLDHRCQTLIGDFFQDIPAGADAYYLQHIIHDWADEPSLKILANLRRALSGRKDGRLLLVESVVPQNSEPHISKLIDLEMLLMPGGRERSEQEWHELLGKAGFEITCILPMKAAESVIEAKVKG